MRTNSISTNREEACGGVFLAEIGFAWMRCSPGQLVRRAEVSWMRCMPEQGKGCSIEVNAVGIRAVSSMLAGVRSHPCNLYYTNSLINASAIQSAVRCSHTTCHTHSRYMA